MAIGQSFWMSFGWIPQVKKQEQMMSPMFPWLDENQSQRLIKVVQDMWIEDSGETLRKQQEIYREVLPQVKAQKQEQERAVLKNQLYNQAIEEKEPQKQKLTMAQLKMEDLADIIKKKYWLNPNAPTEWILESYNKLLNDKWVDPQLVADYMNWKSDELLKVSGLIDEQPVEEKNTTTIGEFLWWKPISTEREVSQFLDPLGKKWTGWANPWTALNLVGKSILNLIPNTVSFVEWVGSMIFHPRQTVEWLKSLWQWIIDQSQWETDTPQAQMVAGMRDNIKGTVTDPQKLWEWITNNPLDIIAAVSPKWATELVKQWAKLWWKAVKSTVKPLAKWTAKASEFVASQAFWINPSTIKTIIKNPKLYNEVERGILSSEEMLSTLGSKIDKKIWEIWETGKKYQDIKKVADITPPNVVEVLSKRWITIDDSWKLDFTNTNMADASDLNAIQKAYDIVNSPNINVINIRWKLDDLINYESKTTSKWQWVIKEMRKVIDEKAKLEIPWLSELDETYWTMAKQLKSIKKDFLNPDWTFKDNALSRISNLTKKWNEAKLERVKELVPWIEENINAVKAFEDVTLAGWQKVGAYFRWAGTAGAWFIAGWPVWAIVWLLLTSPQVATNLLKWIWYADDFIKGIVTNIRNGTKITESQMRILEKGAEWLTLWWVISKNLPINKE